MSTPRRRRARVDLPADLVESFQHGVSRAGAPGSTIVHGWLTQAARYARAGQFDLLPSQSSAPTTGGEQAKIEYSMSADDSHEVVSTIKDGGSSVRAVLAACITAWEAAGYSLVEMEWPRRREARSAAA